MLILHTEAGVLMMKLICVEKAYTPGNGCDCSDLDNREIIILLQYALEFIIEKVSVI